MNCLLPLSKSIKSLHSINIVYKMRYIFLYILKETHDILTYTNLSIFYDPMSLEIFQIIIHIYGPFNFVDGNIEFNSHQTFVSHRLSNNNSSVNQSPKN